MNGTGGVWGGVGTLISTIGSIWISSDQKKMAMNQQQFEQRMMERQNSFDRTMYGFHQQQDEIDFKQNMMLAATIGIPVVIIAIIYFVSRKK